MINRNLACVGIEYMRDLISPVSSVNEREFKTFEQKLPTISANVARGAGHMLSCHNRITKAKTSESQKAI